VKNGRFAKKADLPPRKHWKLKVSNLWVCCGAAEAANAVV